MKPNTIPETIETDRLILRRPKTSDAQDIFDLYASDPDVTKYMSWPTHEHVETTNEVVEAWIDQWQTGGNGGAFLITDKVTGSLLGGTGFDLHSQLVASTGYVFPKSEWGKGYATETLGAILELGKAYGLKRLFAYCHHAHRDSAHVMEKNGFEFEGKLRNYIEFPNLTPGEMTDVLMFAWIPTSG